MTILTANLRRLRILLVNHDLNSLEPTLKWLTQHHHEALSYVIGASATLGKDMEGAKWIMMMKPLDDKNHDTLVVFASSKEAPALPGDVAAASGQKRNYPLWNGELQQSFQRAADAEGGLDAAKPIAVQQRMYEEGHEVTREQVASRLKE